MNTALATLQYLAIADKYLIKHILDKTSSSVFKLLTELVYNILYSELSLTKRQKTQVHLKRKILIRLAEKRGSFAAKRGLLRKLPPKYLRLILRLTLPRYGETLHSTA
jgi:hypothetical protein